MKETATLTGVVRGKVIELEREPGLPDGQVVTVRLEPASSPSENLKRLFGAWAEDAAELEVFEQELRRDRQRQRPEIEP